MEQYRPKNAEDIVKQIEQIDELYLDEILQAIMHRYNAIHDDRELGFLSLSKEPQTREAELEDIVRLIRFCDKQQNS